MADIEVTNEGWIFVFYPQNEDARLVLEETAEPQQWFGNGLVVEHRCAEGYAQWLMDEFGLEVE